jgi:predicted restriction endonuclease
MPLERNLHWAYDKGLFTIESNKVKVHPKVLDTNNYLTEFNEKELILPADVRAHPKVEYFEWHAENVYGLFTQFGEEDSGLSRYL